jgi:mannitol 2-dehydrogenase
MTDLSTRTLSEIDERVARPQYDRGQVTTGIVHFGVGAFHRSHEAMYLDRLMNAGKALDWGICGVGVLPSDAAMRDAMAAQDCLYTLTLKYADGTLEPRVIGSIAEYLFAPDDPDAVIEKMASPQTRVVSLTVTEGGYNFHAVTGEFDAGNPGVVHDLEPGVLPETTFGLVVEAIARRRERGLPPFTVMSCDNIPGNGDVAKSSFSAYAQLKDPELAAYVRSEVPFPNGMVDRITPRTTDDDRADLTEAFGVDDLWPVVCEPFTQWVLEDHANRPPWEEAGVQIVADVEPYELMKLRLLNASHQALCYFGYLSGYRLVHDVCQDPLFARFLLAYMDDEATPTIPPVPGIDLTAYKHELIERFSNPQVRDTVARLCAESSDRIPKWLVPVIRLNLAAGRSVTYSAAVVASWARYAEGVDEEGQPITIVDQLKDLVTAAAAEQKTDPLAFVRESRLFGDLADHEKFTTPYLNALESLHAVGARKTLEDSLGTT